LPTPPFRLSEVMMRPVAGEQFKVWVDYHTSVAEGEQVSGGHIGG
jgi:hypothetical protein